MKVVINKCYGGFGLSDLAIEKYKEMGGAQDITISYYDIARDDPVLVKVVEELGIAANGRYGELKIVEIPDCTMYNIGDYDGMETIHEKHRTWG